ncbi:hypothetical protein JHK82_012440 [Glycine max]|uniref:Uncharacterized protein n=2 Tax=Glycine subgen. Soja TaxID=1462606 RepID=A0A0R0JZD3_SOYBN|nr:hypothetical protein JHK87_012353 [Glycine soja]KAG5040317.1 hypothetical protein JHK85_012793 [Glycine max]KAG5057464.1 hypothetical protein JHK86_012460 [Glycine max]KAG5154471.1 hypothetical protein JHK82_012440 [Glycine max]RZC11774.1 hypothetical protein D0Y65_011818 [Glycine soja]
MALLPPRTWPHVLGIPSSEMKVWAGESLVSVFKSFNPFFLSLSQVLWSVIVTVAAAPAEAFHGLPREAVRSLRTSLTPCRVTANGSGKHDLWTLLSMLLVLIWSLLLGSLGELNDSLS